MATYSPFTPTNLGTSTTYVPVTGITIKPNYVTMFPDDVVRCVATVTPTNASFKSVFFAPLIPRRATVTHNGLVIPHSVGYAGVSATSLDGGFTAVTLLSIVDRLAPAAKVLSAPAMLTGMETLTGMEALLMLEMEALLAPETEVLSAPEPMQETLTETETEVLRQATVLDSLAFATSSLSLYLDSTYQTQLIPIPGTYPLSEVVYTSDHPSIVSVSSTGLLTVLEHGFVTLKATLGSQTATMSVMTGAKVAGVIIDPRTTTSMKRGRSTTVLAMINPTNALNSALTWTSDNPIVASVSDNGHVDTYTAGTATIAATTVEGGYTASVSIRVI